MEKRPKFVPTGHAETDHLLRSPRNAERLIRALEDAKRGDIKPQTIEEFRKEVGLSQNRPVDKKSHD